MAKQYNPTTTAFNVERMRALMLKDVTLPKEFLQKAIDKTFEKLDARKTLFFAHQGEIVDRAEVVDHTTQLAAADKIMSMAGVYARERDVASSTPTVTLEMDPETGVVRLIVGAIQPGTLVDHAVPEPLSLAEANDLTVPQALETSDSPSEAQVPSPSAPPKPVEHSPNDEPIVIKVKRGGLPVEVHKALFGDA